MDGGVQRYQDYHLLDDHHSIDVEGRMSTDDDGVDKLRKEGTDDDGRFRLVVLGSEDTMAMKNLLYRESKKIHTQDDTTKEEGEVPYYPHDIQLRHLADQE